MRGFGIRSIDLQSFREFDRQLTDFSFHSRFFSLFSPILLFRRLFCRFVPNQPVRQATRGKEVSKKDDGDPIRIRGTHIVSSSYVLRLPLEETGRTSLSEWRSKQEETTRKPDTKKINVRNCCHINSSLTDLFSRTKKNLLLICTSNQKGGTENVMRMLLSCESKMR